LNSTTFGSALAVTCPDCFNARSFSNASIRSRARNITLPAALPFLCAAARIVAPSALLGVMVAEWLATGTGMGDLLNEARSTLDYGMIWSVALVSVVVSTGFYVAAEAAEGVLLQGRARKEESSSFLKKRTKKLLCLYAKLPSSLQK